MQQLLFNIVRPWSKNEKGKCPVACILTIIVQTVGLISMKSLSRRADPGFCCHTLALFSFLQMSANHSCQSGKVHHHFVPIGKILKPVLNECVTLVTCYWSLALFLRDEEELMLVFQKSRPPVKMLVPAWKALCQFLKFPTNSAVPKPNCSEI